MSPSVSLLCSLLFMLSIPYACACGVGDFTYDETIVCEIGQPNIQASGRIAHTILPSCTNVNITDVIGLFTISDISTVQTLAATRHHAYPPADEVGMGKLWVHLPGTYDVPLDTTYLASVAQNYHTIHLAYNNSLALETSYCSTSLGLSSSAVNECFWDVRYLMVTGTTFSNTNQMYFGPLPEFNWPYDSIMDRIYYALEYLSCKYPSEGWEQFISNNQIDWSNTILSGHSQGGGHAAVIGFLQNVSRIATLSSVCDQSNWTTGTYHSRTTPTSQWYGFGDTLEDCACEYSLQTYHYNNIGILSYGSAVPASSLDYGGSHAIQADSPTECTSNSTQVASRAFYYEVEEFAASATANNKTCGIFCCNDFFIHLSTQSDICTPMNITTKNAVYAARAWPYILGIESNGTFVVHASYLLLLLCTLVCGFSLG